MPKLAVAGRTQGVKVFDGGISFGNGALLMSGAGAPTNGTSGTGVGKAGPGSLYSDVTNKKLYINTNTKASPTWTVVGTQS